MPIHSQILQWVVPTRKDVLPLDNRNIISRLGRLHWCITAISSSHPIHVFPIVSVSIILKETHITFIYVISMSFSLGPFLGLMILTVLKIQASYFTKSPLVGKFWSFLLMIKLDYASLAGIPQKWVCNFFSLCN